MANLTMTIPHRLPQDEALNRIKQLIAQAKVQYADRISDVQEYWNGYAGAFSVAGSGVSASGNITVNPRDVTIQSTLPFMAMMFKGKIESTVRDVLSRVLA